MLYLLLCRQMLLPYDIVADIIALADILPHVIVVDVITTDKYVTSSIIASWQMLLPYDIVVDVETMSCMLRHVIWQVLFAKWHME